MLLIHDDAEFGAMLLFHDDTGTGEVSQFPVFSPNGSPCVRLSQKPGQTDSNSRPDQQDQFLSLFKATWAPLGPYRGPGPIYRGPWPIVAYCSALALGFAIARLGSLRVFGLSLAYCPYCPVLAYTSDRPPALGGCYVRGAYGEP